MSGGEILHILAGLALFGCGYWAGLAIHGSRGELDAIAGRWRTGLDGQPIGHEPSELDGPSGERLRR